MARIFDRRPRLQSPVLGPDGLPVAPILRKAGNGEPLLDRNGRPIGQPPRGVVTDHRGKQHPYTPDIINDTTIPLTDEERRLLGQFHETGRTAPHLAEILEAVRRTPLYRFHAESHEEQSREIREAIKVLHPAARPSREEAADALINISLHHHNIVKPPIETPPSPIVTPPRQGTRRALQKG